MEMATKKPLWVLNKKQNEDKENIYNFRKNYPETKKSFYRVLH